MTGLQKDPDALVDFGFDWSEWLEAGDSISTSTWFMTAGNADAALLIDHDTHTASATVVYLKAGTVGINYSVTNRIQTTNGLKDDRTLSVLVQER